jgi:hypothetical protein
VTFAASADIKIKKGVAEGKFNVERDKTGLLYGKVELPVTYKNFSGNFIVELGNGTFRFDGLVRLTSEKYSGEVKLIVTDEAEARNIARTKLPPEKILASAEEAKGAPAAGKGPKPGPRAVAGWGTVTFHFTDWLAGQATVIIDSEGHITVVGEITPPAEVELFKQRDYIKPLPKFEARATYGIPVVGNLFVFANIGFEALAKLGPGKIYKIKIAGTYSTDPAVLQDFSIEATLNISAFAGLRVRAEGGAGIEILSHDIKAGVGLAALAGVRGYVEATPKVGYREKADPELGKKGEAYLHGHMEIAAQPFLGLSGDLFVEISTPWWSPLSDHKWTWPIGELEYPLPGQFGIGADVDYLIGSDKLPDIQFGEVDFSADKFMTDLMNDHVPAKTSSDAEKKGEWKEGAEGAGAKDPAVADSQGKPPEGEAATGQLTPGEEGQIPSPELRERWLKGTKAIAELASNSEKEPLTPDGILGALAQIRTDYGFAELRSERAGEDWNVIAVMNPTLKKVVQGTGGGAGGGGGGGGAPGGRGPGAAGHVPTGRTEDDPIDMTWYKPPRDEFYPRTIQLPNLHDREFTRDDPVTIPVTPQVGEEITVGVEEEFWPFIGKTMRRTPEVRSRTGPRYRENLTYYGFTWSGLQQDHVQDLAFSGRDEYRNIWPMDRNQNLSAGAYHSVAQRVTYQDNQGQVRTVRVGAAELIGRWFRIARWME